LAAPTAGGSEVAGQAAEAAAEGGITARAMALLREFIAAVVARMKAVETTLKDLAEVLPKSERFLGRRFTGDWQSEFDNLAAGRQADVRILPDETALRTMFDRWTQSATRLPARGAKIPEVYRLDDGTVIQWRTTSKTGGATVDIVPPGGPQLKVHVGP
jgi:hypothetical protein